MEHIGKQIGKYTITRFIGEGGMASVYEGEHEALGTKAAIKILNPILSANKQIRERFKNEARIMASLDHPNIIRVYDYEESDTYLAIAMELLTGEDLGDRIKRIGKLPEEEIKHIFNQVLSAFEYAHSLGIVHRDIKPSNIYVLSNGTVKILDFGIAKLFGQGNEMTQTGTQMGTPVYMSPEQVKADKSIDHRSDIYSLGVTMFYALSGKPPYDTNTNSQFDIFTKIVHEPLPELDSTSYLADLIRKACQKDREQRFQSCEEWLQQLKKGVERKVETQASEKTIKNRIDSDNKVFEVEEIEKTRNREKSSLKLKKQGRFLLMLFFLFILINVASFIYFRVQHEFRTYLYENPLSGFGLISLIIVSTSGLLSLLLMVYYWGIKKMRYLFFLVLICSVINFVFVLIMNDSYHSKWRPWWNLSNELSIISEKGEKQRNEINQLTIDFQNGDIKIDSVRRYIEHDKRIELDMDLDGVLNDKDLCPDISGFGNANGCPDDYESNKDFYEPKK